MRLLVERPTSCQLVRMGGIEHAFDKKRSSLLDPSFEVISSFICSCDFSKSFSNDNEQERNN